MTGVKLKDDRDLLGVTAAERQARVDNHRRIRERNEILVEPGRPLWRPQRQSAG